MAGVMLLSVKLIFVGTFLWGFVISIDPKFLWNTIDAIASDFKPHCPKVVLYSEDNWHLVHNNFSGWNNTLIQIDINEEDSEFEEKVQDVKKAIEDLDLDELHPCIIVISIVNASEASDLTFSSYANESLQQEYKRKYSHRLVEILQFKTPISCRKLILVRLAETQKDLYFCSKAPKYPRRLVPIWEQILFDFFSKVKVIQGMVPDDEKQLLKVSQESGKWTWLCEDVIERLEAKEKCKLNNTPQCKKDDIEGKFSSINKKCSNETKFRARQ